MDGAQRGRVRRQGRGRLSNTNNRLVPTFMCIPAGYPNLPRPQFTRFLMDDVVDRADRTHSLGIKHTESTGSAASSTRFGGCQVFPASITTLTKYPDPSSRCGPAGRANFLLARAPCNAPLRFRQHTSLRAPSRCTQLLFVRSRHAGDRGPSSGR